MIRNPAEALDDARMKDLLARNLDKYMRRRGITQTELGRSAGILKSTLNTYFTRKSFPNPTKLEALAKALAVGVEDLVPRVDAETIQALVTRQGEEAEAPSHSFAAIPNRPGFSRVQVRGDLPTPIALQIINLVLSAETPPAPTARNGADE